MRGVLCLRKGKGLIMLMNLANRKERERKSTTKAQSSVSRLLARERGWLKGKRGQCPACTHCVLPYWCLWRRGNNACMEEDRQQKKKSKLISKKFKVNYMFLFTIWGSCLLGKTNYMQIAFSKTRAGGKGKESQNWERRRWSDN